MDDKDRVFPHLKDEKLEVSDRRELLTIPLPHLTTLRPLP
jgi:hypothetical protein